MQWLLRSLCWGYTQVIVPQLPAGGISKPRCAGRETWGCGAARGMAWGPACGEIGELDTVQARAFNDVPLRVPVLTLLLVCAFAC